VPDWRWLLDRDDTPWYPSMRLYRQDASRDWASVFARIADALQPGTRTLLTEIDIPNPEGELQPGTYVTVELFIPRKTPSLLVPAQGIIFNANGMQVAVVKDGKANIQKVNVTRDLGTAIEVDHGVAPGDQVILDPPVDLQNGQKVSIREQPKNAPAKKAPAQ